MRLLVIDTETGGVDPERHSLLSLAAVVWSDGVLEAEMEVLVAEPDLVVTAQALEINRIDLVVHAKRAVTPPQALAHLLAFATEHFAEELAAGEQVVLAGHNVGFDIGFLRRLCRLSGAAFPTIFSHRVLDTASITRFLALAGLIPPAAVASTGAFATFGILVPSEMRHTALGDARATAQLIGCTLERVRATAPPV